MPLHHSPQRISLASGLRPLGRPLGRHLLAVLAAAAGLGALPAEAQNLPVIPGVVGPGTTTPAGRGGKIFQITNLNASGPGSLHECVDASGPRVCVFEVSGTIVMDRDLVVRNPRITIAGQTAPSPGIMLRGGSLRISASDVLVQHIRVRPGDAAAGPHPLNRDSLRILGDGSAAIRNIVIDHCSFSWSVGKTASLWGKWQNVSLLNNIFSEPLHNSIHPKGPHGYSVLIGPSDTQVAMVGNLMAHAAERNPLSNATHLVMVNNVIYNWGEKAVDLQGQGRVSTANSIVGNVFVRGPSYKANAPVSVRAGVNPLPSGSKVFLLDNAADESSADAWSIAAPIYGTVNLNGFKAADPPTWIAGLTALPTAGDVTLNYVLKNAGARPADRDSVDKRMVSHVRNKTGQIVNCVAANGSEKCQKNAGGWPKLAENRRALTLPGDPHAVTASGYTNLEVWLHQMAAEVEGRSGAQPVAPTLTANRQ